VDRAGGDTDDDLAVGDVGGDHRAGADRRLGAHAQALQHHRAGADGGTGACLHPAAHVGAGQHGHDLAEPTVVADRGVVVDLHVGVEGDLAGHVGASEHQAARVEAGPRRDRGPRVNQRGGWQAGQPEPLGHTAAYDRVGDGHDVAGATRRLIGVAHPHVAQRLAGQSVVEEPVDAALARDRNVQGLAPGASGSSDQQSQRAPNVPRPPRERS
jgi:hypothetical protein